MIRCSVFYTGMCVLQEELRPEYEEALQEKKTKMKAQMKKKVFIGVCASSRWNVTICESNCAES